MPHHHMLLTLWVQETSNSRSMCSDGMLPTYQNSRNSRSPDIARTLRVFIKAQGHQRTFHKPANHPEPFPPKGNYSESYWLRPPSKLFQFNYFRAG
ncbi:hypothetical protein CISG_01197 [Coccidioides immitis RMSCC 3703]|uniref:Uncharacterized protein n=1 Tax=Coccidioides immitis RMSCC 3703 TaxID=454286 RepID=A0A0J8QU98_COCIT|nr:hypothetical protein CISG_01197 [Coccidioides immitis RMSCC 3703]